MELVEQIDNLSKADKLMKSMRTTMNQLSVFESIDNPENADRIFRLIHEAKELRRACKDIIHAQEKVKGTPVLERGKIFSYKTERDYLKRQLQSLAEADYELTNTWISNFIRCSDDAGFWMKFPEYNHKKVADIVQQLAEYFPYI